MSDLDYAFYNVVAESQISYSPSSYPRLSVSEMIWNNDSYNFLFKNQTVPESVDRPSGCVLRFGATKVAFISHGEAYAYRMSDKLGVLYRCDDTHVSTETRVPEKVTFGCSMSGSNLGCSAVRSCPVGKRLISLRAACNLEYGPVTDANLAAVSAGQIQVTRASDVVSSGHCRVSTIDLASGSRDAFPILGRAASFGYGCREYDENGGDCVIRGEALCL